MRARALLVYNAYDLEKFSDKHVYEAGKMLMESMPENIEFPIRTVASVTLNNFIGYNATLEIYKENLEHLFKNHS